MHIRTRFLIKFLFPGMQGLWITGQGLKCQLVSAITVCNYTFNLWKLNFYIEINNKPT